MLASASRFWIMFGKALCIKWSGIQYERRLMTAEGIEERLKSWPRYILKTLRHGGVRRRKASSQQTAWYPEGTMQEAREIHESIDACLRSQVVPDAEATVQGR